ncbi:MAG TPA: VWA domain-containing protein [Casimicrobiaceae bacterium]|nr:VWA domain-containing protein [Casimicrobiaceae bacterium]
MLNTPAATLEYRAAQRLAGFAAFLRANGFAVGGGDAVEVLRTAERVGVLDAQLLRWSLKALLCGRSEEWRRFDELFDAWFLPPNRWQSPARRTACDHGQGVRPAAADSRAPRGAESDALRARHVASQREVHSSADFRTLMQREHLLEIEALMRRFARRLKHIRLRREARARRGRRLDLPATIRRSVATGGTPLNLAWRNPRRVRPRLVLLIDVSRSMAPYSFFYLRLARALGAELTDVRSFIFHTHLTPVSEPLTEADPHRAQERLQVLAQGWAGGTRIGESLEQFNRTHAPHCVHSRSAVIIMSDGYDTGDPQRLSAALGALRRHVRRLVWINPLCSRADYTPSSAGMQAALPHLDLLAPGADLASLAAVLPNLIEALR